LIYLPKHRQLHGLYIVPTDRKSVLNELGKTAKEALLIYFNVQSMYVFEDDRTAEIQITGLMKAKQECCKGKSGLGLQTWELSLQSRVGPTA
jgi:hypothetical protein